LKDHPNPYLFVSAKTSAADLTLLDETSLIRAIIDAVPDPIFCKDHECRYIFTNKANCTLFGVSESEFIGHTVFEIPGLKDHAELYHSDDLAVLTSGKAVVNCEEPFIHPDGRSGWFLTSKYPIRNAEGRIVGLVGIARDISLRRAAERKLAEEHQKLETLIDAIPDPLFFKDKEGRTVLFNRASLELFGRTAEAYFGKTVFDLSIPRDFAEQYARDDRDVIESGLPIVNREEPYQRKDGSNGWFLTSKFPLRDPEGRISGIVGICRDITGRKEEQRKLEEERAFLETLIHATDTGFVVVDQLGRVLDANAEYVRMTGHGSTSDIRNRNVVEWTALHDQERSAAAVAACGQSGQTRQLEIDYVWPDGKLQPVEINARMIDTGEGRRIVSLCRDIAGRRAAERDRLDLENKMREAQKLESLGVLAGGIAHDFNNLLTAVLGGASLVAADLPPGSPLLAEVEQIETAAARAAELCKQMLAYSGKGRFVLQRLELSQLVSESTELLHLSVRKNAELTLELTPNLPPLLADSTQIQQIIMNLVINASEAVGDEGGTVRVRTGLMNADAAYLASTHPPSGLAPGPYVYLEVSDNGCGMDAEVCARIFDPFFTTKFTGRGLGLAAVLGIVRGHRGALRVDTERGWGTTFRVLLPPAEGKIEPTRPKQQTETQWRGSGTVLLVDDEESVRKATEKMLIHMGFEVRIAVDGEDGLEQFRGDPSAFRLVLLDLTMPRLDGEKTLHAIRELQPDIRVLMMSGFTEQEVAARFDADRPDGFLEKPFRLTTLRDKVRAVIES
jgi:two-component system cell cycle sensor histidine kinase/response regulator CckA